MKKEITGTAVVVTALLFCFFLTFSHAEEKASTSCVEPAKGPIGEVKGQAKPAGPPSAQDLETIPLARVGRAAPDFEANAFHQGTFKNIKLSDYKGKWVVLCFYPGDFTFV